MSQGILNFEIGRREFGGIGDFDHMKKTKVEIRRIDVSNVNDEDGAKCVAPPVTWRGGDVVADGLAVVVFAGGMTAAVSLGTSGAWLEIEKVVLTAGVGIGATSTGSVLVLASTWLVTSTLSVGVGAVVVATMTLSVTGTGRTVAVLVVSGTTADCAGWAEQNSTN